MKVLAPNQFNNEHLCRDGMPIVLISLIKSDKKKIIRSLMELDRTKTPRAIAITPKRL